MKDRETLKMRPDDFLEDAFLELETSTVGAPGNNNPVQRKPCFYNTSSNVRMIGLVADYNFDKVQTKGSEDGNDPYEEFMEKPEDGIPNQVPSRDHSGIF